MNKSAVALIAIAVMAVAVMVAITDPSPNGQTIYMAIGLLSSLIVVVAIICGVEDSQGSVRGDTLQEVHIHNHPAPHRPEYQMQPAAQPQIVYIPMPQPSYPPPQYASEPQYLQPPRYAEPAYLPAPQARSAPAIEHHQAQYRGAIDFLAEPVHRAPQQQRLARGTVAQLESPQAGFIRRTARRLVG